MELVELFIQGLKGAPEQVRVPFSQPVTMLAAGAREQLYVRIVLDLLFPKGTEPSLADLDMPQLQSRVGLTVRGRDGGLYRLLQDVHTGRRALQRVVDGKAEPISNAAHEIAQAVTAQIGFPQEDILRGLFFAVREDLPSQQAKNPAAAASGDAQPAGAGKPMPPGFGDYGGAPASTDKPLPPGFGDHAGSSRAESAGKPLPPGFSDEGAPVDDGRSEAELRQRLTEVEQALEQFQGVKDLEFEIDGLQKRGFELEARLKPLLTLRRSAQQAEDQAKGFADLQSVPGDLVEKGDRLQRIRADHQRELARMEGERDALVESSKTIDKRGRQNPMAVAQQDLFVRVGVGVGVGAIALGVVGALAVPWLRWIALLDIPAFGLALYGGMRVLADLEGGAVAARRLQRLEAERKRLDEKFRIDEQHLTGILEQHGFTLAQLPDLSERLSARDEALRLLEQTSTALREAEQAGDAQTLQAQLLEVQTRLRALEEQLQTRGGYGGQGDLEREKAEIEAALAGPQPQAPAQAPPPVPAASAPASAGRQPAADLGRHLLELAHDVLLMPVEDIATRFSPRASQILVALTDGRFREVRFVRNVETTLIDGASGEELPFGYLPALDRDLAWLSIKIALVEGAAPSVKAPVIFDRSLDGLPDAKGPLFARMLAFMAGATQVVCITGKSTIR